MEYKSPGRVASDFLRSRKYFRGIRGPLGSGKSVLCAMQLFMWAAAQEPYGRDGLRKTRFGVLRNTNPMLRNTTIKTWLDWFPEEEFGTFRWSPPYTHYIAVGDIRSEVIFVALEREAEVAKLLSLDLTAAWVNEAREIPKGIIDALTGRVGRYPAKRRGGPTNYGIIADTNAMDETHWWPIMSGEAPMPEFMSAEESAMLVKPPDWEFFTQPAAMIEKTNSDGNVVGYEVSPEAENLNNLVDGYYPMTVQGKSKDWIDVYILNRLGSISHGRAVYQGSFSKSFHVLKYDHEPLRGVPITVGLDFGLTPAAVLLQPLAFGRWRILKELVLTEMGAKRFGLILKQLLANYVPPMTTVKLVGDPAGETRAQTDENTPYRILSSLGLFARPAPTNDLTVRIEAVTNVLTRVVDGRPGLEINPSCHVIIRGFEAGYHLKKRMSHMGPGFSDEPEKNRFSHPHDALQYALIGEGEANRLFGADTEKSNVHQVQPKTTIWDRHRAKLNARRQPRLRR